MRVPKNNVIKKFLPKILEGVSVTRQVSIWLTTFRLFLKLFFDISIAVPFLVERVVERRVEKIAAQALVIEISHRDRV